MLGKNSGLVRRTGPVAANCHIADNKLWEIKWKCRYLCPRQVKELLFVDLPDQVVWSPDYAEHMES